MPMRRDQIQDAFTKTARGVHLLLRYMSSSKRFSLRLLGDLSKVSSPKQRVNVVILVSAQSRILLRALRRAFSKVEIEAAQVSRDHGTNSQLFQTLRRRLALRDYVY